MQPETKDHEFLIYAAGYEPATHISVPGTNSYMFRLTGKCHNVRTLSLTVV